MKSACVPSLQEICLCMFMWGPLAFWGGDAIQMFRVASVPLAAQQVLQLVLCLWLAWAAWWCKVAISWLPPFSQLLAPVHYNLIILTPRFLVKVRLLKLQSSIVSHSSCLKLAWPCARGTIRLARLQPDVRNQGHLSLIQTSGLRPVPVKFMFMLQQSGSHFHKIAQPKPWHLPLFPTAKLAREMRTASTQIWGVERPLSKWPGHLAFRPSGHFYFPSGQAWLAAHSCGSSSFRLDLAIQDKVNACCLQNLQRMRLLLDLSSYKPLFEILVAKCGSACCTG